MSLKMGPNCMLEDRTSLQDGFFRSQGSKSPCSGISTRMTKTGAASGPRTRQQRRVFDLDSWLFWILDPDLEAVPSYSSIVDILTV